MNDQIIIIPSRVGIISLLSRQIVVLSYKESRKIHIFKDTGGVADYEEGINGRPVQYANIAEYNNAESDEPAIILPLKIISKKLENDKSLHILTYSSGLIVHIDQDGDVVIKYFDGEK